MAFTFPLLFKCNFFLKKSQKKCLRNMNLEFIVLTVKTQTSHIWRHQGKISLTTWLSIKDYGTNIPNEYFSLIKNDRQ